jgi:predicted metal-binding protein
MDNAQPQAHLITVCTDCRHMGGPCRPGLELLKHLQTALAEAGPAVSDEFVLEGSVCMAGCARPCTVSFQASAKATYLFGDIESSGDVEALVSFAKLYRDRNDGMTRAGERPRMLGDKTLARIPAAILSSERRSAPLQ